MTYMEVLKRTAAIERVKEGTVQIEYSKDERVIVI